MRVTGCAAALRWKEARVFTGFDGATNRSGDDEN